MIISFRNLLFVCLSLCSLQLFAGTDSPSHKLLEQRIKSAGTLLQAQTAAKQSGQLLVGECAMCHGLGGNKSGSNLGLLIPNLAQQPPLYLLKQLKKFSGKQRSQPTMHRIAKQLNSDQMVTLALYFSAQSLQPFNGHTPDADTESGKAIFKRLCTHCHGKNAAGHAAIPRLHGQNPDYITTNLKRFRDKRSSRTHAPMSAITNKLTDQEITDLAVYLTTLKPPPNH